MTQKGFENFLGTEMANTHLQRAYMSPEPDELQFWYIADSRA